MDQNKRAIEGLKHKIKIKIKIHTFKPAQSGFAIYVSRSVYYLERVNSAIHRVDLDENKNLEAVEEIESQPGSYYRSVLFQTNHDYCT